MTSAILQRLLAIEMSPEALKQVLAVIADSESKEECRKRKDRERKSASVSTEIPRKFHGNSNGEGVEVPTETPSPSLSFPPAPPLSPSPTPPSPHAPTPTHPHPPTPVREEALVLEIEERPKPDRFDEFWKLYPRKVAKDKAREKWAAVKPELVDTILAAVALQSKSRDWLKNDGQFIPHAATWLHNCRWEDELKPAICSDVQAIECSNDDLGFLTNDDAIFHKDKP